MSIWFCDLLLYYFRRISQHLVMYIPFVYSQLLLYIGKSVGTLFGLGISIIFALELLDGFLSDTCCSPNDPIFYNSSRHKEIGKTE